MKKRFSEEQIVAILREGQVGQKTNEQLCREHGISSPTYYAWKRKYGSMNEPDVKRLRELEKENARLKRLLAERELAIDVMKEFLEKKVIAVGERRAFVTFAGLRELSASWACELVNVSRRRLGYVGRKNDAALLTRLKELAAKFPRFGYRRLHAMLKREGCKINLKRVRRLCRAHGLNLSRRIRRKRRGIGIGVPCRAEYPNHVWAYDFLFDQCENGRKLKVLTITDEFTRLCMEIEVEYRMNSAYVGAALLRLFAEHGSPTYVRSDNGPEFIAKALMRMLKIQGVECRHIEPGSPWQNGVDERFNGSYRNECANLETFYNRDHARAISKLYKRHYNQERPHSSLAYQTPLEFAARYGVRKEEKDVADLSLYPPPTDGVKGSGPTAMNGRPISRMVIHVGAPVASQQSRILRVDDRSVTKTKGAGKVSAQIK